MIFQRILTHPFIGKWDQGEHSEVFLQRSPFSNLKNILPTPALLPINPYDLTDPNNPPEFKWPFFLNGRPVGIGDELTLKHNQERLWVTSLIYGKDVPKVCGNPSFGYFLLTPENFCWPEEVPKKKTTDLWAIPMYEAGLKENMSMPLVKLDSERVLNGCWGH